jgi:ERCC4-related helicase
VWIREARWRVDAARRERDIVRVDVSRRGVRRTFLAPFDRVDAARERASVRAARPQQARARMAGLLAHASDSRRLASAVDAGVNLLPYQLEPALAVQAGARRVLIADDVGLGKTIQAGIVLAEMLRRRPAMRALILCPASLRAQWGDELLSRFRIPSVSAGSIGIQQLVQFNRRGDDPWRRSGVWLASPDYLKQPHVFDALPPLAWDLVIIDEAHAMCGDSGRHAAVSELARHARCLLILTATPHSGDDVKCDRLMSLGSLPCAADGLIVFRRTRRDVHHTGVRRVRWHLVPTSAETARLLDVLGAYESAVLRAAGQVRRPAALLLLSVFRKRALSTCGALRSSLDRRLAWLRRQDWPNGSTWVQPRLHWDDDDEDENEEEQGLCADIGLGAARETAWLSRLRVLALSAARRDSKLEHLHALVTRAREPVVIFTEFRDSLALVQARLAASHGISVIHGGLTSEEQQREIKRFLDGDTTILAATDVAGQGLNLQGPSRWVINLELPWNPARLEQRAGRVDRIGQSRPVHVTMLVARHHAESGLLTTLARKTLAAQRAFGVDTLQSLAPGERQVGACLLAGEPLRPDPARSVTVCRSFIRPAVRLARSLARSRRLARHWRGAAGCRHVTSVASAGGLLRLVNGSGDRLALFTVPVVDRSGTLMERHAVAMMVPEAAPIAAAASRAITSATARAARLQRFHQSQLAVRIGRERAIAAALRLAVPLNQLQPGLFEERAIRHSAAVAHRANEIRDALDRAVLSLEDAASVSPGTPALDVLLVGR